MASGNDVQIRLEIAGLSNWELSNLGAMWKSGELMQPTVVTQDNSEMINLLTDIKNKPTYLGGDYDKTERAIIETVIRQGRKERNHRKTGGLAARALSSPA